MTTITFFAILQGIFFEEGTKKKGTTVNVVVAIAFFVGLRCNVTNEEEKEGNNNNDVVAFLRSNATKQQEKSDDMLSLSSLRLLA